MSNEKLLAAAIVQRSVYCHESAKQTEHTKPFEPFAYSDDNYTQNVWAIAIQTVLYTIRAPRGQDWGRALGCFGWTLHKTGGCRLRSFISSQPPQAEAGHFLSLTYVLYKPRQCPTNSGLFSGKKKVSLPLVNGLLFFPRREWIVLGPLQMPTSIKGEWLWER